VCKCQFCLAACKHNFINMSEDLQADTPIKRAKARLHTVLMFGLAFLKYVGLFFLGIMTGGGIVLRNPPEDKQAKKQIQELVVANENLKKDVQKVKSFSAPNPEVIVRDTVLLP